MLISLFLAFVSCNGPKAWWEQLSCLTWEHEDSRRHGACSFCRKHQLFLDKRSVETNDHQSKTNHQRSNPHYDQIMSTYWGKAQRCHGHPPVVYVISMTELKTHCLKEQVSWMWTGFGWYEQGLKRFKCRPCIGPGWCHRSSLKGQSQD